MLLTFISESIWAASLNDLLHANKNMQEMNVKLARVNKDLDRFVKITAHHLQEPLRNIASSLQLVQRHYPKQTDTKLDEFMHYAVDGSIWMKKLLEDLVLYTNLEKKPLLPTYISCDKALQVALQALHEKINRLNAVVEIHTLPEVTYAKKELVLLFQNLLGNALKFHGNRQPVINVYAKQKGNEWLLSVTDNGIGIAPEYNKKIFEVFERLHTRTEYHGTGIGLAVCKKIVERHGGNIWVESEPKKGSTFYFTIPVGENNVTSATSIL
jgi:light-regulated signal transduction histidine kinase (bacteriophytochrome)